jgi:hypothetical protein
MKTIHSYLQSRRSLRMMRMLFFAVLSISGLYSNDSYSQTLTSRPVTSTNCGDQHCCQLFTFTAGGATSGLFIQLHNNNGTSPSPACWDFSCVTVVAPIGITVIQNPNNASSTLPTPPGTKTYFFAKFECWGNSTIYDLSSTKFRCLCLRLDNI